MKNSTIGNLLIVFGICLMLGYTASRMCELYPEMSRWMGGSCWLSGERDLQAIEGASHHTSIHFFKIEQGVDIDVTKAAVYALGESDTEEARRALLKIVHSHAPIEIRKAALHALAQNAGNDYIDEMASLAVSDEPLELRKAAVHVLQNIGSEASRRALVDILNDVMKPDETL